MEKSVKELEENWRKDPKNWKLGGLFYCNKEDKRLLVDKPNPNYGTTLNFAHRKSYIFMLMIFLFFGFIIFMVTKKQ
ncbi:DUF5808 domain-containing protein [Flavobacterium sp.]